MELLYKFRYGLWHKLKISQKWSKLWFENGGQSVGLQKAGLKDYSVIPKLELSIVFRGPTKGLLSFLFRFSHLYNWRLDEVSVLLHNDFLFQVPRAAFGKLRITLH